MINTAGAVVGCEGAGNANEEERGHENCGTSMGLVIANDDQIVGKRM